MAVARGRDKSRCDPGRRGVVDSDALERLERSSQIGNARLTDRSDVPLRSAVSAALSSLKHRRDIFGHRFRRDEAKVGGKAMLVRERRLLA